MSWYWIEGQGYLPHSLRLPHEHELDAKYGPVIMEYGGGMDTAESVQADQEIGPRRSPEYTDALKAWLYDGVGGNPR